MYQGKRIKVTLAVFIFCLSLTVSLAGDDHIAISFSKQDISLHPHYTYSTFEAQINNALYEGLVTYHPKTLVPLPGIAESWEVLDEGLAYRFHLRDNAVYTNGDPITADDFRSSWLNILKPGSEATFAILLRAVKNAHAYGEGTVNAEEVGIIVEDKLTLRVEMEYSVPHFLKILCHPSFVPVHPSLLNIRNWNDKEEIISNGPYKLDNINDSLIEIYINNSYWDKENVSIEKIDIFLSNDPQKTTADFNTGRIDWIASGFDLSNLADADSIQMGRHFATSFFYFNCKDDVWKDPKIRRGLALLLPWEELRNGNRYSDKHLVPPFVPGYPKPKGIDAQNKEEAYRLLEEAGYPKGKGLPQIIVRVPYSGDITFETIVTSWQGSLETEILLEISSSLPGNDNDDYTLGMLTWIGDYPDPMSFLEMWKSGSSLNNYHFSDSEFDEILIDANTQIGDERYKRMAEAEERLLSTAQVLPLYHSPSFNIIDLNYLDGWYPNILDIHPLKDVFISSKLPPGSI